MSEIEGLETEGGIGRASLDAPASVLMSESVSDTVSVFHQLG